MLATIFGQYSTDRREARRLARQSLHLPYVSLLIGSFVLINLISAIASIIAVGPANGMP